MSHQDLPSSRSVPTIIRADKIKKAKGEKPSTGFHVLFRYLVIILGENAYAFWQSKEVLQLKDPSYDQILMPCDVVTNLHNGERPYALED